MPNKPECAVFLQGDDGKVYKLTQAVWQVQQFQVPDNDPNQPQLRQAVTFGTILANVNSLGVGIGMACVFVNVPAVVNRQR
jgi:hypothetical protein